MARIIPACRRNTGDVRVHWRHILSTLYARVLHPALSQFIAWPIQICTPARRRRRERFILPAEWLILQPILDRQPTKIRVYFYLLIIQGPRMSEPRLMQWPHVDFDGQSWFKPHTKNGHSQFLPLSPQICLMLRELPHLGPYVFPGHTPDVPWSRTAIQYHWRKMRHEAHLDDVQIRDLRRTCASWLAIYGENLKVIQAILDHSSLATTEIYARLDQRAAREALTRHAERVLA